ncbi:MAG: hypothetical protein R3E02_04095 [Blastomonas sp.]
MLNLAYRNRLIDTDNAIKSLRFKITNSFAYRDLPIELQQFVHGQLFGSCKIVSRTPSSALLARRASAAALQSSVQMFFNDLLAKAPEPYFATFAYRAGEVPMGHGLRNTQTLIQDIRAALLELEMDGVLTPDIDLLLLRGEQVPVVAFHLHGIVFSTRQSRRRLRLKKTAERLDALLGMPSRMASGSHLTGKRMGDFRSHAENMATYAGKIVAALKVETRKDGKPHLSRTRSLFTPYHAFNLLHAWSQIPVSQTVIPVGASGEEIHQGWFRKINGPRIRPISGEDCAFGDDDKLWDKVISSVNSGNAEGHALRAI